MHVDNEQQMIERQVAALAPLTSRGLIKEGMLCLNHTHVTGELSSDHAV